MTTGQKLDRSKPLQEQVTRNIRNAIDAGVVRDGEVLPSTRELAKEWDVSVYTISEALKVLETDGYLSIKSRSRRTVTRPDKPVSVAAGRTPTLLLVGGYAGSGKTELGRILSRNTGWPILDKDTTTRAVVEHALEMHGVSPNDRESETYLANIRPREYEALLATATENIECGVSAIITAPFITEFNDPTWIARSRARFEALNATVGICWVRCDAQTMHTYLRHRGAARDSGKLAAWDAYLAGIDPKGHPAGVEHIIENSADSEPLQAQAKRLLGAMLAQ